MQPGKAWVRIQIDRFWPCHVPLSSHITEKRAVGLKYPQSKNILYDSLLKRQAFPIFSLQLCSSLKWSFLNWVYPKLPFFTPQVMLWVFVFAFFFFCPILFSLKLWHKDPCAVWFLAQGSGLLILIWILLISVKIQTAKRFLTPTVTSYLHTQLLS